MIPERTIGESIRFAREERGLSQEEVSKETRLSLAVIRKLELDRFGELPGGLYTQNYIRILADHLGMDSAALLARLKDGQGAARADGEIETWQVESVPEIRVDRKRPRAWRWGFLALVVLVLLVLAALFSGRMRVELGGPREPEESPARLGATLSGSAPGLPVTPEEQANSASRREEGEASVPETSSPDRSEAPRGAVAQPDLLPSFHPPLAAQNGAGGPALLARHLPVAERHVLEVRARGACFLHVTLDEDRQFSRRFPAEGGRWRLYAQDNFVISGTEAGRLELRFDGENVSLASVAGTGAFTLRLDAGSGAGAGP